MAVMQKVSDWQKIEGIVHRNLYECAESRLDEEFTGCKICHAHLIHAVARRNGCGGPEIASIASRSKGSGATACARVTSN